MQARNLRWQNIISINQAVVAAAMARPKPKQRSPQQRRKAHHVVARTMPAAEKSTAAATIVTATSMDHLWPRPGLYQMSDQASPPSRPSIRSVA